MGIFDGLKKAQENAENRRMIAEYSYEAQNLIKEAQEIYENAFYKTKEKSHKLKSDVEDFVEFKKKKLKEMNTILEQAGVSKVDIQDSDLAVNLNYFDASAEVYKTSDFLGGSAFNELSLIFGSIRPMSLRDFWGDTKSELYEAKSQRNEAKAYKQSMRNERERMYSIISSMDLVRDFMNEEQRHINELMQKLKNAVNQAGEGKKEALLKIAAMLAKTMSTNFLTNNFTVTSEYAKLHEQIKVVNNSAGTTNRPCISWDAISNLLR